MYRVMRFSALLFIGWCSVSAPLAVAAVYGEKTATADLEFKAPTQEVVLNPISIGLLQAGLNDDGKVLGGVLVENHFGKALTLAMRCSTQAGVHTTSADDPCQLTLSGTQGERHLLHIKTAAAQEAQRHFDAGWWVGPSTGAAMEVLVAMDGTQTVVADTYPLVYEGGVWTE